MVVKFSDFFDYINYNELCQNRIVHSATAIDEWAKYELYCTKKKYNFLYLHEVDENIVMGSYTRQMSL